MNTRLTVISILAIAAMAGVPLATERVVAETAPASIDAALAASSSDSSSADSFYGWPLAQSPTLTSSFAEYRPGHFHAGVDFSTSGAEGRPVLAVADGEVVRVRASGIGYGRAVYLRLRDGRLAVYAHLSSMWEPLARYVEAVQDSLGLYRVDLYPEPGRFPVRRGQEIGRSGSSGAGAPHLHFELREGDIAVNPLTHGLSAHDERPPILRALVFTSLDAGAHVNGGTDKVRVPLTPGSNGEWTAAREVRIWGRVGVGLQGSDRSSGAGDRLGFYEVELEVDGEVRFRARFDRFDYHHNHEVEAEFDYEEALAGRRSVQNLFVPPGVTGDFHREFRAGAGILEAGESGGDGRPLALGAHRLRVVAADAAGNRTAAVASVRVVGTPVLHGVTLDQKEGGVPWLRLDGRGHGAKLQRIEVERGTRGEPELAAWRAIHIGDGELGFSIGQEDIANPHDVLGVRVVDDLGQRSNRLTLLARASERASGSAVPATGSPIPPSVRLAPSTRIATLELQFAAALAAPPVLTLPGSEALVVDALDSRRFIAHIDARGQTPLHIAARVGDGTPIDVGLGLEWAAVRRATGGSYIALDGRVRIDFPAGAFFDDAYVWAGEAEVSPALPPGIILESPWIRIEPNGLPLDRGLWVGLRFDSTAAEAREGRGAVGLYRLAPGGELVYEGAERGQAGYLGAQVRKLGHFALARDVEPPVVRWISPAAGKILASGRPRLRARVRDLGSGFREDDVAFFIDGRRVPTEWDAEADLMLHRPSSALAAGRHAIVAQATDHAGLTTRREITVTVR